VFRLAGASFGTADDVQLNAWHERLNALWRDIGGPTVALWVHVVRRRDHASLRDTPVNGFAADLARRYYERLATQTLMTNEIYLSVVYRPALRAATGAISKALSRGRKHGARVELVDALDTCAQLARTLQASLARYEPQILRTYRAGALWCSSILEFLGMLINGEWQRMPLPAGPLSEALATTRLLFGNEAIEYRTPTATRIGAILGIKEYPAPSTVGMFDRLLSVPFSFVLTQSFAFLAKSTGQTLLQRQFNRMGNAGDFAV